MTYLTHDELPVCCHFQNGHHENWRNHIFAYKSASRVDRNENLVLVPMFLRVKNLVIVLRNP